MKIKVIMDAVRKGSTGTLERVPSAGMGGRNNTRGAALRAFHPNSTPVHKTQTDALGRDMDKLSINDRVQKTSSRSMFNRVSGTTTVRSLTDAASLLESDNVKNIVVVAGAGISTPSGIPDFRSPGTGLYDNLQQYQIPYPEAIFDIDYFHANPRPFFTLAKELYPSGKYRPNYIHYFARLLYDKGILLRMYTQNIDGLERLAGLPEEKLVEAHGTFATATCTNCRHKCAGDAIKEKIFADKLPRCPTRGCVGIMKPDIVFFGEDLPRKFYSYMKDMLQTDMVLVMGTSLEVQPFAGIIDTVRMNVPRILFNRDVVGPFRYGRRSQDLVAAGDLVNNMVKFTTMAGWKQDMVDLITREEGEFSIDYKKNLPPKTQSKGQINKKPPPAPPTNRPNTRDYSTIIYRQKAQLRMFDSSSSEESSDSDSDVTSSDSSEEETKNKRLRGFGRGRINNSFKNGATGLRNGFRSSSAKLGQGDANSRRLSTEKNAPKYDNNVFGGSLTGRSAKSDSGINGTISKRRLDKKKVDLLPLRDKPVKKNGIGVTNAFTKVSQPQVVSKEERARVLRKYGLSPSPNVQTKQSSEKESNALSKVSQPQVVSKEERARVVRKYGLSPSPNVQTKQSSEKESKPNSKTPKARENGYRPKETKIVNQKGKKEKVLKPVKSDSAIVSGYFIEDSENEKEVEKNQNEMEKELECKDNKSREDIVTIDTEAVDKEAVLKSDSAEVIENVEGTIPYNRENASIEENDNKLIDALINGQDPSESERSQSVSEVDRITRALSEKAAKSFAKYANLNPQNKGAGHKGKRKRSRADKPPAGPKKTAAKKELGTLNPRPYGYSHRQRPSLKGVGPFQRTTVRAPSMIDHTLPSRVRPGSAETPKISYRHRLQQEKVEDTKTRGTVNGVADSSGNDASSGESR